MIKLQDLTPEVYYKQSRDFQFIGRLYDVVLNSVKTNADLIAALPLSKNSDEKLIDLMTLTLGFTPKHNYNIAQLTALCSAFCEVLRNKGSLYSIETAANVLLHAEGINQKAEAYPVHKKDAEGQELNEYDYTQINVFIPNTLSDINLFKDILNYILPAGMSCNIIRSASLGLDKPSTTDLDLYAQERIMFYDDLGDDITNRNTEAGTFGNMLGQIPQLGDSATLTKVIDVYAKATGGISANSVLYQDNETSSSSNATLISFNIGSDSYQAESGMTWTTWCASTYNTDNWQVDGSIVYNATTMKQIRNINATDTITANTTYTASQYGG